MSPPRDVAVIAVGTRGPRVDTAPARPVARPRLLKRLHAATRNRVTLLSAPAGFGKSTLLQQLRSAHSDTVRLLPSMAPPPACACPEGTVIVIDEREPRTRPLSTDDVVELIEELPDDVHFVVSRRRPWTEDDLALFGSDSIERFTGRDLTFTDAEAEALLRRGHAGVTAADAHLLWERTGGWAAGLGSAVIAMRDIDDVITYIEVLGGDDRHVAAYLRAEVIAALEAEELELLTWVSAVESLEPGLCAWMTTDDGARARLLRLCAKGIIEASPRGPDRSPSYVCHPMLRDHLWRTLKEADPVTARTCATRAALWHTIRGELVLALQLYVKGEAWNGLLQMIDRTGKQLVRGGHEREVADALSQVPPAARGRRRSNLLDYAAFQTWGGDRQAAEDTLVRLTDQRAEPIEEAVINVLHAARVRLHGRGASATQAASAALGAIRAGVLGSRRTAGMSAEDMETYTWSLRATARWYDGDVAGARADFEASIEHPCHVLPWHIRAEGGLALLEASSGGLNRAESLARMALAEAEASGLSRHPSAADALLALALVDRERNALRNATRRLDRVQELAKASHESVPLAIAMIEQARCELAAGDVQHGLETLSESRRDLAAVQSSRFTQLADAVEAQLLLTAGRGDRALKLLTSELESNDSEVRATTVRALLEQRLLDEALRCLKEWDPESELRPSLQFRLWSAVADHAAGSRRTATRSFVELAAEAETEGYVRLFLDGGPLVTRLLHDTLALQPTDYLQKLFAQMSSSATAASPQDGPNRPDVAQLLSQRELEVVRYLPTRLSAIEIAEHLYISYNTLKSHMRSIYRKFDVSSRQELIERAEELGLA